MWVRRDDHSSPSVWYDAPGAPEVAVFADALEVSGCHTAASNDAYVSHAHVLLSNHLWEELCYNQGMHLLPCPFLRADASMSFFGQSFHGAGPA